MRLRYPIPRDGQLLKSEHLHDQTLFGLAEAGLGLRGVWGFFRAPDLSDEDWPNEILVERGALVIRNLALLSPDGLVLRGSEELREPFPGGGGTVRVVWKLPAHNRENEGRVSVHLEIDGGRRRKQLQPWSVVIGEIEDNVFSSSVPVLSLDGSAAVAVAWAAIIEELRELERLIGRSSRGDTFHRRLVESELRGIGRLPLDEQPRHAVIAVETAVERFAAFAEAHGADEQVMEEIERTGKGAAKSREAAGGLTALVEALGGIADMASPVRMKRTREWLEPESEWQELSHDGEIGNSPLHTMRHYRVDGARVGRIRIRFERKDSLPNWARRPEVSYRFDEGAFLVVKDDVQEERTRDGNRTVWTTGDLEIPDGAELLRVRFERDVAVRVELAAGARSAVPGTGVSGAAS